MGMGELGINQGKRLCNRRLTQHIYQYEEYYWKCGRDNGTNDNNDNF